MLFRFATISCLLVATITIGVTLGCGDRSSTPRGQSRQLMQRRTDRGETLLSAAIAQLQDLPSYIETNLRAPSVLLDSTASSDGQDVYATCTLNPEVPDGVINYLFVPEGNSRFRTLGVRPGDIVKYYVLLDEESFETGIAQQVAMDLTVAQVLNDNTLLIAGGLSAEVREPAKIEIWRYEDDRLVEINRQLSRYVGRRPPSIGWEPSPDEQILGQIVVRLNQWLRQTDPNSQWKIDPLWETIDQDLRADERLEPFVSAQALGGQYFQPHEGRLLQEAVWLRDISRWARGNHFDAVDRAAAIFDWTVRNIQLDSAPHPMPHRPWQTLLYGHGTAEERAWVFAMLCWQQGLDVVILELVAGEDDSSPEKGRTFWLPALLTDGKLYLFDTRLGLAIPGPEGEGIATLDELRADGALLRQLDLADAPYPITSAQLDHVVASIVASPFNLSRRAAIVDSRLSGDDKLLLSIEPSRVRAALSEIDGIDSVRLWDLPVRTLRDQLITARSTSRVDDRRREAIAFQPFAMRPKLWKARTRHFQGRRESVDGDSGDDRPSALRTQVDDHLEARQLYTDPSVRPPDRVLARITADDQRQVFETARLAGTYWLGLLSFDDGNLDVATHWLSEPVLTAGDSPWRSGARYNLARALEALGKTDQAVELLEESDSPQQHGDRLRAKWLKAGASQREEASGDDRTTGSQAAFHDDDESTVDHAE